MDIANEVKDRDATDTCKSDTSSMLSRYHHLSLSHNIALFPSRYESFSCFFFCSLFFASTSTIRRALFHFLPLSVCRCLHYIAYGQLYIIITHSFFRFLINSCEQIKIKMLFTSSFIEKLYFRIALEVFSMRQIS